MNTDWALQVNKMLVIVSRTKMGFTSVLMVDTKPQVTENNS